MNGGIDGVVFTRARLPSSMRSPNDGGGADSRAGTGDTELVDLVVVEGTVVEVTQHGASSHSDVSNFSRHDLEGHLVLPAFVEPHAHLDKALTADVVPNPRGDLLGAIEAWVAAENRGVFDFDSMVDRATAAIQRLVTHGVTAIRTHVNVGASDPTHMHLRAVRAARDRCRLLVDVQIVALMHSPLAGRDGRDNRRALEEALAIGVDFVGGCPHLETDGPAMIAVACETAREAGIGLDLHVDETLDPTMLTLRDFCRHVEDIGISAPVAASHCVSLAMQPLKIQEEVAAAVARAAIDIIALPQTNLFLQGRQYRTAMPRGITPVGTLREFGVRVAAGGDNVQDPFNPVGRSDPLETAALMIMATHQLPHEALAMVGRTARSVLGLPEAGPYVGACADFVVLDADTERQAIADAPLTRRTYRRGQLTAVTRIERSIAGTSGPTNW